MSQSKDPNQGEGDRRSARRYDKHVRQFIDEDKVSEAANEAKEYVERAPDDAAKAEREAKRGPKGRWASVDDLVAKGHTVIERARPFVERAVSNLRARFSKKQRG